jgi:hypothetical protein
MKLGSAANPARSGCMPPQGDEMITRTLLQPASVKLLQKLYVVRVVIQS